MTKHHLERIDAGTVASLVKQGDPHVAIVDVRDSEEFASGHIKSALNLDSSAFGNSSQLDKLIEHLAPKTKVVVHCAKSLERGPASAIKLKERLSQLGHDKDVVVLDGGFNNFGQQYAADSSLIVAGAADKEAVATSNGHEAKHQ